MIKIANGFLNERNIDAVIKQGANYEVIMASGARFPISDEDAQQFLPDAEPVGKSLRRRADMSPSD